MYIIQTYPHGRCTERYVALLRDYGFDRRYRVERRVLEDDAAAEVQWRDDAHCHAERVE